MDPLKPPNLPLPLLPGLANSYSFFMSQLKGPFLPKAFARPRQIPWLYVFIKPSDFFLSVDIKIVID